MNNKKQTSTTTPDYKAMLKDLGAPIIKAIGGRAKAMEQAKLMQALLHFKAKSGYNDLENIVAYALVEYKANLIEHGYRKYDKNYLPIVMNYGDAIDLCGLWLIHYADKHFDICSKFIKTNTNITQKEYERTIQRIFDLGEEASSLNNRNSCLYDTIIKSYDALEKQFAKCKVNANTIRLYLTLHEANTMQAATLNFLQDLCPELKAHETDIAHYLKQRNIISEGGKWEAKEADKALENATLLVEPYERKLTHLKAMIIALERWAAQNNMEIFMPMRLRNIIKEIKGFRCIALPKHYYISYLDELRTNEAEVTPEAERLAIVPTYDNVMIDENDVSACIEQLQEKFINIFRK